ncbi:hypothetical protein Purlil1_2700 [Purpureocillium lilacinum]|uniref:Uncharacterized protein n=2 Tax=Purpureocillium lilacinum TaxID=33203 RepID=A0ABR0C9A8_PURLI|nr:hypothetical protein Purlil1_2700 [Purpureocillium lilacinum]
MCTYMCARAAHRRHGSSTCRPTLVCAQGSKKLQGLTRVTSMSRRCVHDARARNVGSGTTSLLQQCNGWPSAAWRRARCLTSTTSSYTSEVSQREGKSACLLAAAVLLTSKAKGDGASSRDGDNDDVIHAGGMHATDTETDGIKGPSPPPSPGTRHGPKVWVVAPPGACGRSAPPGFCRALVPALPRETRRHGTQGLPLNEVLAGILCCSLAGASDGATSEAKPPTSPVHVRPDHRSIGRVGSCKKSLARVEEERRRRRCWARLPSFGPP